MGTAEVRKDIGFSFSTLVMRVAELQEAFSASKEARCSLESQCARLQEQLDDARTNTERYKNELNAVLKHSKEKESQLHGKVGCYLACLDALSPMRCSVYYVPHVASTEILRTRKRLYALKTMRMPRFCFCA